jgi:NADH dehydrogenase [ubiquinone] 1 alpha subcomplex assembly factor 7
MDFAPAVSDAGHMTEPMAPLEIEIRRRITAAGPMPIGSYMSLCLADPQHGYYVTRDPFGRRGDFTTAPEVSQMFGELIGLWIASLWQQMGSPENIRIVELGPGRGTMMADAMRAAKVVPAFISAAVLHLVEISPALQAIQEENLSSLDAPKTWHRSLSDVPAGATIFVANEFFDALPINQAVKMSDGWHRRGVAIASDGALVYQNETDPMPHFGSTLPETLRNAAEDEIFEWRSDAETKELGQRIAREPSAALVIDYGHSESATGETLQAVRDHLFADPLTAPGDADLTAHVDFEALRRGLGAMGAIVFGPIEQSLLLKRLGIDTRAETLRANLPPAKAHEIDNALARLTGFGRTGMGTLFKAMAVTHPSLGTPPGFKD